MHKKAGLGILIGGGAILAAAVVFRPNEAASETPPNEEDRPRLMFPTAHEHSPFIPAPPPAPHPPAWLAAKAFEWRARAEGDAAVIERLGERLLSSSRAPEVCEMIALVLGSLSDPRGVAYLRRALDEGCGTSRASILIALTLDCQGEEDQIFWRPDVPGVIETACGCRVRLRRVIAEADLRGRAAVYLLDPDIDVRRTAYRILEGSVDFADVRVGMLRALEEEADPALLELLAFALSRWAGEAQAEDPMKRRIVATLLDRADEESVRSGSRAGLRRAELTVDERVRILRVGGTWADEILD